jgi:GNAT superfamily N-acetyltransferase
MYTFRDLIPSDLAAAQALSEAVGWPHRLEDWQFMLPLGRGVAAIAGNRLAGTAVCWPWGPGHATLGMIIVAPRCQGKGLGRQLLEAARALAGDRVPLLHATAEGLLLYRKSGFAGVGTVSQHQGFVTIAANVSLPAGDHIRPIVRDDLPHLAELDREASGLPRAKLLEALAAVADAGSVLERRSRPTGFAFRRRYGRGRVIGPVIAPEPDAAKALIASLLQPGMFLRLDLRDPGPLGTWLDGLGMRLTDCAVAMAAGTPPRQRPQLHALVSQSLG